ncbi:MAG: hypothetical protein ACI4AD_00935 [Roseburia sp.]
MRRKKVIGVMAVSLLLGMCGCGAAEGDVAMVSGGETAGNQETVEVEASEIEVSETESSATEASGESETESPATEASEVSEPDDTYAEETEEEDIIRYAGAPQLAKKAVIDLDGDGKEETIELNLEEQALVIDGVNYPFEISLDEFEYKKEEFAVVDIDVFDSTKEILVQVEDMEVFSSTEIYRYEDKNLKFMGSIFNDLDYGQMSFDGNNHVYKRYYKVNLVQDDFLFMQFDIGASGKLEEVWPEEGCYYMEANEYIYTLLEELPVYAEKDHSLEPYYMKPQKVAFQRTDGKNWIELLAEDGTIGWMYVEEYAHIVDLNKDAKDVFEGLTAAG